MQNQPEKNRDRETVPHKPSKYIVGFWESVEPFVCGPYDSDKARLQDARRIYTENDEHCLCRLDMIGDMPVISSFINREALSDYED